MTSGCSGPLRAPSATTGRLKEITIFPSAGTSRVPSAGWAPVTSRKPAVAKLTVTGSASASPLAPRARVHRHLKARGERQAIARCEDDLARRRTWRSPGMAGVMLNAWLAVAASSGRSKVSTTGASGFCSAPASGVGAHQVGRILRHLFRLPVTSLGRAVLPWAARAPWRRRGRCRSRRRSRRSRLVRGGRRRRDHRQGGRSDGGEGWQACSTGERANEMMSMSANKRLRSMNPSLRRFELPPYSTNTSMLGLEVFPPELT